MTKLYLARHGQILTNAIISLTEIYEQPPLLRTEQLNAYLNRHGKTIEELTALTDDTYPLGQRIRAHSLTSRGRKESHELGIKLKTEVRPDTIFFVTSTLERTIQTATEITRALDIPLGTHNHTAYPSLQEELSYEAVFEMLSEEPPHCVPKPLTRYRKLRTIGKETYDLLVTACNSTTHDVIAITHHGRIYAFLDYLYRQGRLQEPETTRPITNCALFTFSYRDGIFEPINTDTNTQSKN